MPGTADVMIEGARLDARPDDHRHHQRQMLGKAKEQDSLNEAAMPTYNSEALLRETTTTRLRRMPSACSGASADPS